jgi:hypothetical protein
MNYSILWADDEIDLLKPYVLQRLTRVLMQWKKWKIKSLIYCF